MKKFRSSILMLATLLMAGAAITSCTSDDVVPDPQPNDEQTYLLTRVHVGDDRRGECLQ